MAHSNGRLNVHVTMLALASPDTTKGVPTSGAALLWGLQLSGRAHDTNSEGPKFYP